MNDIVESFDWIPEDAFAEVLKNHCESHVSLVFTDNSEVADAVSNFEDLLSLLFGANSIEVSTAVKNTIMANDKPDWGFALLRNLKKLARTDRT